MKEQQAREYQVEGSLIDMLDCQQIGMTEAAL